MIMNMSTESFNNSDYNLQQLIGEYDEEFMSLPGIDFEPHLLISKVRKHYMDYIVQLLCVNYEKNRNLENKNIHLPSAIWRCAKNIETKAAQTCMVVQLYRKNIIAVIKELKHDNKSGKLNKKLYQCLHQPPENEKSIQTSITLKNCDCQCNCNTRKKTRKLLDSPQKVHNDYQSNNSVVTNSEQNSEYTQNKIPVVINSHIEYPQIQQKNESEQVLPNKIKCSESSSPNALHRMSVESHDSDELMMQLEKLFQGDPNDDDIFDGALCDTTDSIVYEKTTNDNFGNCDTTSTTVQYPDVVIEKHSAQIKSLDDRLATLAGLIVNNTDSNTAQQKSGITEIPKTKKQHSTSKWLCEEYYLKMRLLEVFGQIGDSNRKKYTRIKEMLLELFGDDSDDEEVNSPLEETPEFIISCKERIAPWVVKILTPYYIRGQIKGKALFKALAKHLIRLIYQCSHYPREYEVHSFVTDFLANHKCIRCEADFKQFRIENI